MTAMPSPKPMTVRATLVEIFENGVVCRSRCVYNSAKQLLTEIEAAKNFRKVKQAAVIRQYVVLSDGREIHEGFTIDMNSLIF